MPSFAPNYQGTRMERVALQRGKYGLTPWEAGLAPYTLPPECLPDWGIDPDRTIPDDGIRIEKLHAGWLDLSAGWNISADGSALPATGQVSTATRWRMRMAGVDKIDFDAQTGVFKIDGTVQIGTSTAADLVSGVTGANGAALTAHNLADAAQGTATTAAGAAATAQTSATAANTALTAIASDNVLSAGEKSTVMVDYNTIVAEQSGLQAQATAFGVSTANYTNYNYYVSALTTYLNTLVSPYAWNNLAGNTTIEGWRLREAFMNAYFFRQELLNAIYAKAKVLADNAQTKADTAVQTGGYITDPGNQQYVFNLNGLRFYTADTGQRVEINSTGVGCYDPWGVLRTTMSSQGFSCQNGSGTDAASYDRLSLVNMSGIETGCLFSSNVSPGLVVAGLDEALYLEAGLHRNAGQGFTWVNRPMELAAGDTINLKPGLGGGTSNVNVFGGLWVRDQVGFNAGPSVFAGDGAPGAGLGQPGSLYCSSGGSLYFKQAAGWRRIDNWAS